MNNYKKIKETKIDSQSYILSTGEIDIERLTIMNELFNPASLDFLELRSDINILTVGCGLGLLEIEMAKIIGINGNILATDISLQQLNIAYNNITKAFKTNISLKHLDIANLNLIDKQFDRIHCRFVLSHMPWKTIEKLIPLLMSKLSSTGGLIIEEVSCLESLYCEPFCEEYELWKTYIGMQWKLQNADSSPGLNIYNYLNKKSYLFKYRTYQSILKNKKEKRILALGIRSLAQGFINKKIVTPQQIQIDIKKIEKLEENKKILPSYCGVSQFYITNSIR